MFRKRSVLRVIVCTMVIVFSIGMISTCFAAETHEWKFDNAEHLYHGDATVRKAAVGGTRYIDGFKTTDGFYWVCMDSRLLFMRVQDSVLKCKTQEFYEKMIHEAMENNLPFEICNNKKIRNLSKGHKYYIDFNCKDGYKKNYKLKFSSEKYGEEI